VQLSSDGVPYIFHDEDLKRLTGSNRPFHSHLSSASFDSDRLEIVRNELPDVCLSMGPKEVLGLLLKSYGLNKKDVPGDCLQIPIYKYGLKLVTKRFVDFVHSQDLKIMVWTINDKKNMDYLISLGVDGIITDKPKFLFDLIK